MKQIVSSYYDIQVDFLFKFYVIQLAFLSARELVIPEWQWLLSFSSAVKSAEALSNRTAFPESFRMLNKDTRSCQAQSWVRNQIFYKREIHYNIFLKDQKASWQGDLNSPT